MPQNPFHAFGRLGHSILLRLLLLGIQRMHLLQLFRHNLGLVLARPLVVLQGILQALLLVVLQARLQVVPQARLRAQLQVLPQVGPQAIQQAIQLAVEFQVVAELR